MRYEFFLARRYLWGLRRSQPFVSVIATISILGVALGVAALLVVPTALDRASTMSGHYKRHSNDVDRSLRWKWLPNEKKDNFTFLNVLDKTLGSF